MYGYIRPYRDELKIRDYELFRGTYCGLCHALKKRYGFLCRFLVNYDFTFLAMLLSESEKPRMCIKKCIYHPLRRTACPEFTAEMDHAADCTVILAWWKLRDTAADGGFIQSLAAKIGCLFLKHHYRKAEGRCPGFAVRVKQDMQRLAEIESKQTASLDAPADTFADILRAAAWGVSDETRRRILEELLYHVGRIVYLLDAADDLPDDMKTGNYNPLLYRFKPENGILSDEDTAALRLTLQHSHNAVSGAFELLPDTAYTDILNNIIYFGLPAVAQAVFSGEWNRRGGRKERSNL